MINLLTYPDSWTSAYDDIKYTFKQVFDFTTGTYSWTSTGDTTIKSMSCDNMSASFTIGDLLDMGDFGLFNVYGFDGANILVKGDWSTFGGATGIETFTHLTRSNILMRLKVGYRKGHELYDSRPIDSFADFYSFADYDGIYSVRIGGLIQAAFKQIQPPVIGKDPSLFIHYLLTVKIEDEYFSLNQMLYSINGCLEDIATMDYVQTNSPLIEEKAISPYSAKAIESRIIDENVVNDVIIKDAPGTHVYSGTNYQNTKYLT